MQIAASKGGRQHATQLGLHIDLLEASQVGWRAQHLSSEALNHTLLSCTTWDNVSHLLLRWP